MTETQTGPTATPDASALSAPADDGVDVEGALSRLDGNRMLYREIIQSYLPELQGLAPLLDRLLAADDRPQTARVLHTAKGLAATVGATELAALLRQAESELKQCGAQRLHCPALNELRACADRAYAALQALHASLTPEHAARQPPADRDGDRHALIADLQMLRSLLASSDMQALAQYQQLADQHSDSHGALLVGLQQAIAAFDFARAVVQCDALTQQLSPKVPTP